jgi:hypothetical protein
MNYIITLSATLTILAASSGQIPKIVYQIRLAQLEILKEMHTSKWGTPWTPTSNSKNEK